MSHWAYVAAAYGLTIAVTAALLGWTAVAMRRAERAVDALRRD